jgi:hypothetical protein
MPPLARESSEGTARLANQLRGLKDCPEMSKLDAAGRKPNLSRALASSRVRDARWAEKKRRQKEERERLRELERKKEEERRKVVRLIRDARRWEAPPLSEQ